MNIVENLKSYFSKKENKEESPVAPEGICPNCWGHYKWDGEYYEFMKGENSNPSTDTYNNFIKEVARKLDKIVIHKDTYTCSSCEMSFDENK